MTPLNSINFKWEKNSNGATVVLELYKEKSGNKKLIVRTKIKSAHNYLFKDLNNLDEGNFIWTLQESSDSEEEGKIRPKTTIPFKIYLSNKPEAPKIKTPEKIYVE
ncbi:MAG: hypothetical protein IPL26_00655 [Leptospiraceae bacterium]|nr:hypothetical protein [Leptospiraceae bacterium]